MIHKSRRYSVRHYSSMDELVTHLTDMTWCGCNAFEIEGVILANDSFSADGAQEYAVIREGAQVETLTVSWMTPEELRLAIQRIIANPEEYETLSTEIPKFDHPKGACYLCA